MTFDTFLARHGQVIGWLIATLVVVGIMYGDLRTTQDAFADDLATIKSERLERDAVLERQLDRIEQHVLSIEEHLRTKDLVVVKP